MSYSLNLPRYIAICGFPTSGKSKVQEFLQSYGVCPVDDGRVLRDTCKVCFDLTEEQVTTQAGKREFVTFNGRQVQVRDLLGEMGNYLERQYGPEIIAEFAVRAAHAKYGSHLRAGYSVSFGSVRREQAADYKRIGKTLGGDAICLGVRRPGVPPSPFEFDAFNPANVDVWIENDGDLNQLRRRVDDFVLSTSAERNRGPVRPRRVA